MNVPVNHRLFILLTSISLMFVLCSKPVSAVAPGALDAARDLFSYRGMFNSSEAFLNLYFEAGLPSKNNADKATHLIEALLNPNIFQKDLKLIRFQIRLSNDPAYREQFHHQLSLAFEHYSSLKTASEFRAYKKSKVNLNAWDRNWQSGDLSYGIGFMAAVGASVIAHVTGAGEVATFVAPIITLPTIGLLSRIVLTHSGYTKATREANWAENKLKEAVATMAKAVTKKVGMGDFPIPEKNGRTTLFKRNDTPKNLTEVIKLASHSDGSPLMVQLKDLKDALDFRNDLPVYKGVESQLIESEGSQFYPTLGVNSQPSEPLKSAKLFTRILIPISYRKGGQFGKTSARQEVLLAALTKILNQDQFILQQVAISAENNSGPGAHCVGLTQLP